MNQLVNSALWFFTQRAENQSSRNQPRDGLSVHSYDTMSEANVASFIRCLRSFRQCNPFLSSGKPNGSYYEYDGTESDGEGDGLTRANPR